MKIVKAARVAAIISVLCAAALCSCGKGGVSETPETPDPSYTVVIVTPAPASAPPEPTPYDGARSPLTGLPIDASLLNSRPVAVMLNNRKIAQPQLGIASADIIVEALVEGGITRMLAIYQDVSGVGPIGSVRSSRPYYIDIAQSFDAVYIHAGGSANAYTELISRGVTRLDGVNGSKQDVFYRDPDRRRNMGYEHSMLTSGELLAKYLPTYGFRLEHEPGYGAWLNFEDGRKLIGTAAEGVKLEFSSSKSTSFEYSAEAGEYLASQHGGEYTDGNSGERAAFANLLILKTSVGIIKGDPDGCLEVGLSGGEGYLAIGGRYAPIEWTKGAPEAPFSFTFKNGGKVTLRSGRTYLALIPSGANIVWQ
ncbi:MAG: DUF3048 domain-containing protein [Oscillospiraceae bacterium]|jgi:hypothetical protein|nr:DUF3048 domain-containing protein [Oscillospiraceae bacterium]